MFTEMMPSSGGGGTVELVYATSGSNQNMTENIPESDYVLAMATGNAQSEPCIIQRGESKTITAASTTIQIALASDGKSVSWTKSTAYYYVVVFAIAID